MTFYSHLSSHKIHLPWGILGLILSIMCFADLDEIANSSDLELNIDSANYLHKGFLLVLAFK